MEVNLGLLLTHFILSTGTISFVFWFLGRTIFRMGKIRFIDALLAAVIGSLCGVILGAFVGGVTYSTIQMMVWVLLVKYFFDYKWEQAAVFALLVLLILIVGEQVLVITEKFFS